MNEEKRLKKERLKVKKKERWMLEKKTKKNEIL